MLAAGHAEVEIVADDNLDVRIPPGSVYQVSGSKSTR
jgi:hypothetical protein